MKKFEALQSITDTKKYSELVFDLVAQTGSPEKLSDLLSEEFSDGGLQTIESIARSATHCLLSADNNSIRFHRKVIKKQLVTERIHNWNN